MELIRACRNGDVDACRQHCPTDPSSISIPPGDLSPLHWVIMGLNTSDSDCSAIIHITEGVDVNHRADNIVLSGSTFLDKLSSVTALHLTVFYKGTSVLRDLLSLGANPDLQDSNGNTALLYACREGEIDKVQVLLADGADASMTNNRGESAFSLSASSAIRAMVVARLNEDLTRWLRLKINLDLVARLLCVRADVNARDTDGTSALSLAIRAGAYAAVIEFLEADDLRVSDSPALHDLAVSPFSPSEKEELAHELIFRGADIQMKNPTGKTALEVARLVNDTTFAKMLMDHGAVFETPPAVVLEPMSPSSHPEEPLSPTAIPSLHVAAAPVVVDVGQLAERLGHLYAELTGARVSVGQMHEEDTARPTAAGVTEDFLVSQKMELLKKLNMYISEFDRVKHEKHKDFKAIGSFMELQRLIADCRREITQVSDRISSGDFLVSTNSEGRQSASPPGSQGWFRSPESVEADIEMCVRVIRKSSGTLVGVDASILQLLKRCRSNEMIPVLKLLRNRGADVNSRDATTGMTSLMHASADPECEDLVDWLLANGADTKAVEKHRGWSSLHFAVTGGSREICATLIAKNPDLIALADSQGQTAEDLCNNAAVRKTLHPEALQSA